MIELSKESLESFIAEYPTYITWDDGYILEEIKFRNEDFLILKEKVFIYILAWSRKEMAVSKKQIMDFFKIGIKELREIIKELIKDDGLQIVTTFNQCTGRISGKGYFVNME